MLVKEALYLFKGTLVFLSPYSGQYENFRFPFYYRYRSINNEVKLKEVNLWLPVIRKKDPTNDSEIADEINLALSKAKFRIFTEYFKVDPEKFDIFKLTFFVNELPVDGFYTRQQSVANHLINFKLVKVTEKEVEKPKRKRKPVQLSFDL